MRFIFLMLVMIMSAGCSATLQIPHDSFVNIDKSISADICVEKEDQFVCENVILDRSVGSGVIVRNKDNKVYVLTAGHVCSNVDSNLLKEFESFARQQVAQIKSIKVTVDVRIIDFLGKSHNGVIKKVDQKIDACLISSENINMPAIKHASIPPKIGEEVWNISSPYGMSYPGVTPLVRGYFAGNIPVRGTALYSNMPATPGSSGSPIFNIKGELIGMIHSINIKFPSPQWAYGVSYENLRLFINEVDNGKSL